MGNHTLDRPLSGNVVSIQFLRFVAAFIVVLYHAGLAGRDYALLGPAYDGLLNVSIAGEAGVHIFFVISGFIMVYATRNHENTLGSVREFLFRRFARIYPIYWLYCGFYLFFHVLFWNQYSQGPVETVKTLALWPGFSAGIIGPGWTLSYEVFFYLVFGLCFLLPRIQSRLALTALLIGLIVGGNVFGVSGRAMQVLTNPLLLEFLMGVWIAHLALSRYKLPPVLGTIALYGALAIFLAVIVAGIPPIPTVIMWGVPSALLVLGVALRERAGLVPQWVRRAAPLGDGSYSLYLVHNLVLDLTLVTVVALGAGPSLGLLWTLLAAGLACVVAHFAYERLERPLHRALLKRRSRAGSPAPAGNAA